MRRFARAFVPIVAATLAWPAGARAHGIQGRADLPVPLTAFYWAAGIVLVVSFIGLAVGWRQPLLQRWLGPEVAAPEQGGPVRWIAGLISFLLLALILVSALFGSTDLNSNFAPIAIFVVWWIGIAVCAGLLFDVWRWLHPVAWLARLLRLPDQRRAWSPRVGVWPGAIGLLAFCWLELVYPTAADVRLLGSLVLVWALATLAGMWRWGVTTWLDHGEPFSVYTGVLANMAPRSNGRWRVPFAGLTRMPTPAGSVVLVALLIGTVSYDGLSRTLWWKRRVASATVNLVERGFEPRDAQIVFGTFGLVLMVSVAVGAFLLAALLARMAGRLPRTTRWGTTAEAFAPALVPIALAYVIAHYFSYFWFQSQRIIALASDPLGRGWDLFGTTDFDIDYSTLSANAIWAIQLGAIIIGHVIGLIVAHDRALEIEQAHPESRGVRSQWPMLGLMILFTIGGLYFLSEGLNA